MKIETTKVLMVVDNGITGDSRVQKSAAALAKKNYEVVLLGIDTGEKLPDVRNVEIVRLPLAEQREVESDPKFDIFSELQFPGAFRSQKKLLASREKLNVLGNKVKSSGSKFTLNGFSSRVHVTIARKIHAIRKLLFERKNLYTTKKTIDSLNAGSLSPINQRYEDTFIEFIVSYEPDYVHAHDFKSISVGALAVKKLKALGKPAKLIYDAHEFLPGLSQYSPEWLARQCDNESKYILQADCVITVSSEIADLLVQTHDLPKSPTVVLNAPAVLGAAGAKRNLRVESNVGDDVLLGLYVGVVKPTRGLDVIFQALETIPELHITFLTRIDVNVLSMKLLADSSGVGDRLHVAEYVSPDEIVPYIRNASFGIAPMLHTLNQEISLPSKFYEYACAKLPIVGSDVAIVKAVLDRTSVGEVFEAGNPDSFTQAVLKISNNLESYRAKYINSEFEQYTWEYQAKILGDTYNALESTN